MTPVAFGLDRAALSSRAWAFGRSGEPPYAPRMLLLEDGRVGGYRNRSEHSWSLDADGLVLRDRDGRPTTRFDRAMREDGTADGDATAGDDAAAGGNGAVVLEGPHLASGAPHRLVEAPPPERRPAVDAERVAPESGRRCLVFAAGGGDWLAGAPPPADRCWDLCAIDGDPVPEDDRPDGRDLRSRQPGTGWFDALASLLHPASALWRYDRFLLAGPRVRMGARDPDRLFARMRAHDLLLAQPAFGPESVAVHPMLRARVDTALRFTSFVDAAAPVFARAALAHAAPCLAHAGTGAGLGHLWSFLLGPGARLAVLDEVVAELDAPLPDEEARAAADAELLALCRRFQFDPVLEEYGALGR